jgi:hypothetical protein
MREQVLVVLRLWELAHLPQPRTRGTVQSGFGNYGHCAFEPSIALDEVEKEVVAQLQV